MAKWNADTLNAAMDALVSNGQLMDRIKAQDAAIAELVEGLREIAKPCEMHPMCPRGQVCDYCQIAQPLIAKYEDKP